MDNQERAQLLLENEKAEAEVARLKRELFEDGDILGRLAQQLHTKPENIVFSNAPSPLGNIPPELINAQGYQWEKVGDMTKVAQRIQNYRAALKNLWNVKSKLQSR
jgi:hypothetical protein